MCHALSFLSSTNRSCWTYGPVLSREDSPYSKSFDRCWTSSRTRKDKVSSILRSFIDGPKSSPFEEGWVEIEDEEGSEEGERSAQPSKRECPRLSWPFGYGEKSPKGAISKKSIIAVILLFCRMRTWFPWTLIHEIVSMRFTIFPSTVHFFSLHWHLFPLTFIEYYWKDRSDQSMRKVISRPRGMLLVSAKSALWLFPSAAARIRPQQAALDARQRKWKIVLLPGRVSIEISCSLLSPRHKGLNISPIFIKLIFFYLFPSEYNKILSVLQKNQTERS